MQLAKRTLVAFLLLASAGFADCVYPPRIRNDTEHRVEFIIETSEGTSTMTLEPGQGAWLGQMGGGPEFRQIDAYLSGERIGRLTELEMLDPDAPPYFRITRSGFEREGR